MSFPVPENEEARLAALVRYRILDTPPEVCFDRLTALIAQIFQAPITQINFVDRTRAWPKSSRGLQIDHVQRDQSVCTHAILSDDVMVIPDLLEDSRFFDNPFVIGPPRVRFYAGAPLKTADGYRLGTVCVYDFIPRHHIDAQRIAALETVAGIAMDELEQRLAALEATAGPRPQMAWSGEVFTNSPAGLTVVDEDGSYVEVNPAFCRLSGYGRDELIGRPFTITLPPEAREQAVRIHKAVIRGAEYPPAAAVLLRKDQRPVEVYVTDARYWRADRSYALSAFVNVSEVRQAEEQIRRSEKLEAVRRLAGGVAHNINNLLTIIVGYSQIMAESFDAADLRRRYADEISDAAERAALITSQLLTFSRHGVIAHRVLDLNEVVAGAERELRGILGEGVAFAAVLRPEAGKVRAGAGQIEQVLRNLALNAKEAMPQGGSLTIETSRIELDEDYSRRHPGVKPGDYALLTVTDTGLGMDPDTRSHLFEPYFTTKGIGKGTGLAVVYGIMRQCGGDLAIYSEPRGGTTIGLYFPRLEDRPEAVSIAPAPVTAQAARKLLIVEDEPEVLQAMRQTLESQGYTILTAVDSDQALHVWEREGQEIQALIADVALPGMSGPELAEILLASRPGLKVLYVSGYSDEVLPSSGTAAENILFLQKPFTPDALRSKVRELLERDAVSDNQ